MRREEAKESVSETSFLQLLQRYLRGLLIEKNQTNGPRPVEPIEPQTLRHKDTPQKGPQHGTDQNKAQ